MLQGSKNVPAVLGCQVSRLLRGQAAPSSAQPAGRLTPCTVSAEGSRGQTEDMAAMSCSVTALCRLEGSQIWSGHDVLPFSGWG